MASCIAFVLNDKHVTGHGSDTLLVIGGTVHNNSSLPTLPVCQISGTRLLFSSYKTNVAHIALAGELVSCTYLCPLIADSTAAMPESTAPIMNEIRNAGMNACCSVCGNQ